MGIVQSCYGSRHENYEKSNMDPGFHANMIENRNKVRIEKYSQLYDVLEQTDKNMTLLIDNVEYEAQLPLIQDEPFVVNAKSEHNRSFINLDQSVMYHNQSINSPDARSEHDYKSTTNVLKSSMFNVGKIQIEQFDSEVIDSQEDNKEEEKLAFNEYLNIQDGPQHLSLEQTKSDGAAFKSKKSSFNLQKNSQQLQINTNTLSIPTKNQQKRMSQILRLNTGAGAGAGVVNEQQKEQYDETRVHMAYVFASPLVLEVSKGFLVEDKLDEISFKEEFEYIQDALELTGREVKYLYQLGTLTSMSDVLSRQPLTLHFSGHGLRNERQTFRDIAHPEYHKDNQKRGNILVMEGSEGGNSELLFGDVLKKLIAQNKTQFKFVVVASCHSEEIGKIFSMGGAEHVICVKTEKELNDKAAVTFAREFYKAVYRRDMTICEAYHLALTSLDGSRGLEKESKDYILMTQENHQCKPGEMFKLVRAGKAQQINEPMKLRIVPPNVTSWVPRSLDTYQCIQKLFSEDSRIVQVFGIPGSGKSAILLKASNYLAERDTYSGGIVYANFQNYSKVRKAFMELIDIIETHNESQFKQADVNQDMDDKQIMDHLDIYIKSNQRMLFVFDNMDELIQNDGDKLADYLNKLVRKRKNLRLLFSASVFMEKPLDSFIIKNIKNLKKEKARDLFIKKIPLDEARTRFFSYESMMDLQNFTIQDENLALIEKVLHINPKVFSEQKYCKKSCQVKGHKTIEDCGKSYLEKHPLFQILNQPLSICLAAAQLKNQNLSIKNIYENLIKANEMSSNIDCSLIVSYMSAFQMLGQQSEYALEILYVISQTATGLMEINLQKMFNQLSVEELKKNLFLLEDASMIIFDPDTFVYKVQNIIGKFVELSLDNNPESRVKYTRMLASFYLDMLTANKQFVNDGKQELKQLIEITDYWEKNITKCLNFLISLRFEGRDEDLERNPTIKTIDLNIHNRQYAMAIAKQLTQNFKKEQGIQIAQEQPKKDTKSRKAAFKGGKISKNTIDIITQPLQSQDAFKKYQTFKRQNSEVVSSPNSAQQKKDFEKFVQNVKKEVFNELKIDLLQNPTFPDVAEVDEDVQSSNLDVLNQIEEVTSDFDEHEFSDDDAEQASLPQELEAIQEEDDTVTSQGTFHHDQPQAFNRENPSGLPNLNVFDHRSSWSQVKASGSGDKKNVQNFNEIQINKLQTFKKNQNEQLQPKAEQNLNIGKRLFGGLVNSNITSKKEEIVTPNDFGERFKQIMQVIGSNINEKLRKLNDKVTEKEAKQYKETVSKFSQFIGTMMIKPSNAVDQYINNPKRQWSRRPTTKNFHKDSPGNLLIESPHKDAQGRPIEQYGNSLGIGLLAKARINRQASRVSVKSAINRQLSTLSKGTLLNERPPTLALDKIDSNMSIAHGLGMNIQQPELDDYTNDENYEDNWLQGDEEIIDDGVGEMQILLYHFMSIQALKNKDVKDFINLKNQFLIDQMDPMFRASIDLLLVYQYLQLKQKTNHQYAATELQNLLNTYKEENSQKGLAIVNFFLSYIFKNTNTVSYLSHILKFSIIVCCIGKSKGIS